MINIYKCLEDFKSMKQTDQDFPLEFFESYIELHQNLVELKHLITNDPDNIVEIQTLVICMLSTGNSFNDHINDIQEFLQFYSYSKQLDQILKA